MSMIFFFTTLLSYYDYNLEMDYNNGSIFLICQKAKGRKIPGFITLSLFGWAVAPLKTLGRPAQGRQGSCRPSNERQDLNVIFFEFAKRSLAGGTTGACRPPPTGDRGSPTLYKPWPPFPSHLSPKIAPKIQKKERVEEKKSGEALQNCALVIYR